MASKTTVNLTIAIPKDLDERLRKEAAKRYGTRKGILGKAVSEAIQTWLTKGTQ